MNVMAPRVASFKASFFESLATSNNLAGSQPAGLDAAVVVMLLLLRLVLLLAELISVWSSASDACCNVSNAS